MPSFLSRLFARSSALPPGEPTRIVEIVTDTYGKQNLVSFCPREHSPGTGAGDYVFRTPTGWVLAQLGLGVLVVTPEMASDGWTVERVRHEVLDGAPTPNGGIVHYILRAPTLGGLVIEAFTSKDYQGGWAEFATSAFHGGYERLLALGTPQDRRMAEVQFALSQPEFLRWHRAYLLVHERDHLLSRASRLAAKVKDTPAHFGWGEYLVVHSPEPDDWPGLLAAVRDDYPPAVLPVAI